MAMTIGQGFLQRAFTLHRNHHNPHETVSEIAEPKVTVTATEMPLVDPNSLLGPTTEEDREIESLLAWQRDR